MDGWSDTSEEEEGGEEEEDEEEGDDFSNDELEEDEEDDSASARLWEPKSAMYGACRLLQSFALKFLALFMCFKIFSSLGVSGWSRVVGIIVILSRLLLHPSSTLQPTKKDSLSVSRFLRRGTRHFTFEKLNGRYEEDSKALGYAQTGAWGRSERSTMPVISQLVARHFWPSTLNESGSPGHPTPTSRSSEDAASKVEQRVFVIELGADVASALPFLTDVANFLTTSASAESDEVVFVLTSPGGSVTEFGLAAEQLGRIRRHGLPLTVCVDLIAASGGYMIAAVSSKLLCAPFAMVGSIGVITMTLNAHRAIKKRGLDVVTIAAGKYKAPISLLSELNAAALDKQQEVVDTVHGAFKQHIAYWRPWVDVDRVGNGEVFLGLHSKSLGLIDGICSSEEYLQERMKEALVISVKKYDGSKTNLAGLIRRALLPQATQSASSLASAVASTIRHTILLK